MNRNLRISLLTIAAAGWTAATVCQAQFVSTHHVRDAVRSYAAPYVSRLSQSKTLQLDLVLKLRDPAGLRQFLSDVYNPASPSYRHFLTVPEFTARFGPTQDDYEAVLRFAKTYGFEVVGGSRDGMDVQVKGSVAAIESAFHVNMGIYRHPTENRTFYSPDREPTTTCRFPSGMSPGWTTIRSRIRCSRRRTTTPSARVSMPKPSSLMPLPAPALRHPFSAATCAPPTTAALSDRRRPEPRIA